MSTSRRPAVSVLLPVRDGMPFLPRAIDSLLAQTWTDFELIAIDDGSTDGTRHYLAAVGDPRLSVIDSGGGGLAVALNHGLARAQGEYIARQDADDWSAPGRLEQQLRWLTAHPDIDVLATAVAFVDRTGRPVCDAWTTTVQAQWDVAVTPAEIAELMPLTCCLFHATVVARTDVLRAAGGYDQTTVPAEDYDLWLRLLPHARFARLPEPLYTVRVHADSSSARQRREQTEQVVAAKLRYVRRQVPALAAQAAIGLPCHDRGAAIVAQVGPREGFRPVDGNQLEGPRDLGDVDVVAITDFSKVPAYASQLRGVGRFLQFGNLFVRAPEERTQATSAGRKAEVSLDRG